MNTIKNSLIKDVLPLTNIPRPAWPVKETLISMAKTNGFSSIVPEWNLNPPTTDVLLGQEIEIEGIVQVKFPLACWNTHTDGSLRNGIEFVSSALLPEELMYGLKYLQYCVEKSSKLAHFSWRCSIHLHIGVRTLTERQFVKMLLLYLMFEKSFFRYANTERRNSIFCVPLLEVPEVLMNIIKVWKGLGRQSELRSAIDFDLLNSGWHKYAALGIYRLNTF